MMFYLLSNTCIFNIEYTKNPRLEASCKEERIRVWSKAKTFVISWITEFIGLFQFYWIPQPDRKISTQSNHII